MSALGQATLGVQCQNPALGMATLGVFCGTTSSVTISGGYVSRRGPYRRPIDYTKREQILREDDELLILIAAALQEDLIQ